VVRDVPTETANHAERMTDDLDVELLSARHDEINLIACNVND